jgi:hypothetical protein
MYFESFFDETETDSKAFSSKWMSFTGRTGRARRRDGRTSRDGSTNGLG